ncbi:TPA: beta-CASP ribonuclease aCPSF1 [Candidatus Micrarchaeota archaeon]|nr:beta-CASP ribonuclease aCPSF1 [Candidatus Micrarchaeota archaeon]
MNSLKEMREAVQQVIPPQCELTRIEVEGPQVVLYLKNIRAFYEDRNLITRIASRVRKKILLRSDSSALRPPSEALARIKQLIPIEAGVTEIKFDPVFNEVQIEALKPGLVIGKGGIVLKTLILETGWSPKVLRAPTSPSEVERAIRSMLLNNAEERKKFLTELGKTMLQPSTACDWVKITALGAFREVGRSCMLLQTPESNILIDCGINVETTDPTRAYPYLNAMNMPLEQIDAVILTHAHLDHAGFIPYLYAYGYNGPTYCTPPTRDLSILLQQDCVNVMNSEGKGAPYTEKDIRKELNHMITREYGEVTDVTPDVRFTFHNAGHILGSSIIHLHVGEGLHNIVHTGDIKFGRTKLFDPASTYFPRIETLLIESTYGGTNDSQPPLEESATRLGNIIRETIQRRGKVLIPVFAVGRAQEIMLVLEEQFRDSELLVYLDGMSKEASAIHTVYPEYLRKNIQRRILTNDSPFEKPLFKHVVSKERKAIAESDEPCVILAPSGMLSGGTSLEFLKMMCTDERNSLIFVGYQSASSLGRKIQNGHKEVPVLNAANKLDTLKINMQIHTCEGYSGHSDRSQLMAFVRSLRPKPGRVFTMHGDENPRGESKCESLARSINKMLHCEARAPMNLDTIRLK